MAKKLDLETLDLAPVQETAKLDLEPLDLEPVEEKPETTLLDKLNAGLQGFGQGATFGYLPQLQALADPALAKVYDWTTGSNVSEDLGDYTQRRDDAIKRMDEVRKKNPMAFGTGELTGGLTSAFLPGGAVKTASLPLKMLAAGGAGAAQSFIQNPGDVEGVVNPWQLGDRGENALTGGAISAVVPALPRVGKFLRNQGEELAFKALGPFAAEAKKALARDKVRDIGAAVLKEKIPGILPRSNKKMGELLENSVEKSGQAVNDFIAQADKTQAFPISKTEMGDILRKKLLKPSEAVGDVAGANARNKGFGKMIENFENGAGETVMDNAKRSTVKKPQKGIKAWWETSKVADDLSGWNKDTRISPLTPAEEYNRALSDTVKEGFDRVGDYRKVSQPYSNLKEALKITQKREGHDLARQLTSPWALTALGGVGGATQGDNWEQRAENALYGALLGKSIRGAEKLYKQGGSRLLNRAGRMLEGTQISNPWLVPSIVRTQQGDE